MDAAASFGQLKKNMREAAASFLSAHGAAIAEKSDLFVWASVHHPRSHHPPHVHSDAMVSGVYYASPNIAAGQIMFEDPRGRGLFEHLAQERAADEPFAEMVGFDPKEGRMLVFPPWLAHRVAPAPAPDANAQEGVQAQPRVSFSFNLLGGWAATSHAKVRHITESSTSPCSPGAGLY